VQKAFSTKKFAIGNGAAGSFLQEARTQIDMTTNKVRTFKSTEIT
jgi:hypothetical protein